MNHPRLLSIQCPQAILFVVWSLALSPPIFHGHHFPFLTPFQIHLSVICTQTFLCPTQFPRLIFLYFLAEAISLGLLPSASCPVLFFVLVLALVLSSCLCAQCFSCSLFSVCWGGSFSLVSAECCSLGSCSFGRLCICCVSVYSLLTLCVVVVL